jgi:hypothetical protein
LFSGRGPRRPATFRVDDDERVCNSARVFDDGSNITLVEAHGIIRKEDVVELSREPGRLAQRVTRRNLLFMLGQSRDDLARGVEYVHDESDIKFEV